MRKTIDTITPEELAALYELLAVRYPCDSTAEFVATFTVDLAVPKERPRVTLRGTYTPQATKEAENVIGWRFRQAARGHRPDPKTRFGVILEIIGAHHAADVDNLAKTVLDGLNKICWADDKQVDELHVHKRPGAAARTQVAIYRIGGAS